jgi:hypothetical protein
LILYHLLANLPITKLNRYNGTSMKRSLTNFDDFWQRLTVLAILAGIMYNSWPLGHWLNPAASGQLASALEARHQPYNWVFISGDVISSLLVMLVAWLIWRKLRPGKLLGFVLWNVVIFGVGTIADTLLPEACLPGAPGCQAWPHNPLLLTHGIFSILASVCLFVALLVVWWRRRQSWWLNGLMAGYVVFSLFSLIEAVTPASGNWSQHYYITLCGVWLALIPYGIQQTFRKSPGL